MQRRGALITTAVAALSGCGFQLRQSQPLPMRSIALVGFAPTSPLAAALRLELERAGVALRDNPAQAETVFDALQDAREKCSCACACAFALPRPAASCSCPRPSCCSRAT
jgi:outer membrane lipopolysaccharide assembly protein LptE/RlpB